MEFVGSNVSSLSRVSGFLKCVKKRMHDGILIHQKALLILLCARKRRAYRQERLDDEKRAIDQDPSSKEKSDKGRNTTPRGANKLRNSYGTKHRVNKFHDSKLRHEIPMERVNSLAEENAERTS